jgi:hypothetical protein
MIKYWDTVVLPTWAVRALVNGEPLEDEDERKLDDWLADLERLGVNNPSFLIVEDDPNFTYANELDDLGADCYGVEVYREES